MKLFAVKLLLRYGDVSREADASREADTLEILDAGTQRCVDEEVVTIVAKSLLRDRDARYANAGAMKKDLERIDR